MPSHNHGFDHAYDTATAYNVPNQIRWVAAVADAYPTPIIIEAISTILSGTLLSFDWTSNHYLAPRLVINYPAANVVQNTTYQPSLTFAQSGMALRMRAGEVALTWASRPQTQLAPWQITMPTPGPYAVAVRQFSYDHNSFVEIPTGAHPLSTRNETTAREGGVVSTPCRIAAVDLPIGVTGIVTVR